MKDVYLRLSQLLKKRGGGIKFEVNDTFNSCNDWFSIQEQINYLNLLNKDQVTFHEKKIEHIEKLLRTNRHYPNVNSKKQIQYVIDSKSDNLFRLVKLCQKRCLLKDDRPLLKLFLAGKSKTDDYYYDQLKLLMKRNKPFFHKPIISIVLYVHIKLSQIIKKYNIEIKKYLDIGCGNGRRTKMMGSLLNLERKNIYGADIENWFDFCDTKKKKDGKNKRGFNFVPIKLNKPIPLKNVDCITMMHSLHHMKDLKYRLKDCCRMLNPGGLIILIEHDVFEAEDHCVVDIEHAIYERVRKNNSKEFLKTYYAKYVNWIEIDLLMNSCSFDYIKYYEYDEGFQNKNVTPTKSYMGVYRKRLK